MSKLPRRGNSTALIHKSRRPSAGRGLGIIVLTVLVGTVVVWQILASGTPSAFEAEQGTVSLPATMVTPTGASGGSAVQFAVNRPVTGPPYYFGSLVTSTAHASDEAPTMKLAMIDMSWARAEGTKDVFDDAYLTSVKNQVTAFRAAGRQVVLGLGVHYSPAWAVNLSHYVNQAGTADTTNINLVFSQAARTAEANYIAHLNTILPLNTVWAVRINNTGGQGEMLYPDKNYWAFSTGAQNGADAPTGLAPNPSPGWHPGDVGISTANVGIWAQWYMGALSNYADFVMDTLKSTGFHGYYQMITPGSGERPYAWTNDINNKLQTASLLGEGAAWDQFYRQLKNKHNVVAYSSSAAQSSNYNACTPTDDSVPLASTAANSWSSGRWMARIADEYGLLKGGENPGLGDPADPSYADDTASGMMARAIEITETCHYQTFFWAHDAQLWGTPATTSYARFAGLINAANGNTNPAPPFPSS